MPTTIKLADALETSTTHQEIGIELEDIQCKLDGAPMPELRENNLLADIDRLTGYSSQKLGIETPVQAINCDQATHGDGYFTEIVVTPRSRLGEIVISQHQVFHGKCSWGAEIVYCMQVTSRPEGTMILVQKRASMLGRIVFFSDQVATRSGLSHSGAEVW